ncbi:hypothetical protein EDB84DRAFT_78026 [Lactarius hengduanensis]|nr:hypothetical protein EDB84DRAFT_78026 [Lactarius hengduanensis]
MLRFRVFRKCWLAIMALASALCIMLSLSFYKHYDPKTDLCVLIAVPGLCLVASVTAFFAKGLFRSSIPTSVAVECIWTTCFVIFNLILSLYSLGVGADIKAAGARVRLPFLFVEVCCWGLAGLMFTYSSLVVCFSVLTAMTFDRDVWFRDITGSPSPFPVVLGVYTVKLWLAEVRHPSSTSKMQHTPHCLPGCTCKEKVPPPSPPTALPPLGLQSGPRGSNLASAQSVVPGVRVPTALERHNSIFVGLDV